MKHVSKMGQNLKSALLLFLLTFILSLSFEGNCQFKRHIIDNDTNKPVEGALVQNLRNHLVEISDSQGRVSIEAKWSDTLLISHIGYETLESVGADSINLKSRVIELEEAIVRASKSKRKIFRKILRHSIPSNSVIAFKIRRDSSFKEIRIPFKNSKKFDYQDVVVFLCSVDDLGLPSLSEPLSEVYILKRNEEYNELNLLLKHPVNELVIVFKTIDSENGNLINSNPLLIFTENNKSTRYTKIYGHKDWVNGRDRAAKGYEEYNLLYEVN